MSLTRLEISLQVAEKLREIAMRQGNVPWLEGDMSRSHVSEADGLIDAKLNVNTPYARRVHNGSGPVKVRKRKGKALKKPFFQKPREGNPWLLRAVQELQNEGLDFLGPQIGRDVADQLTAALRKSGAKVSRK